MRFLAIIPSEQFEEIKAENGTGLYKTFSDKFQNLTMFRNGRDLSDIENNQLNALVDFYKKSYAIRGLKIPEFKDFEASLNTLLLVL
jgi:hypothetical protein